DLDGEVAPRLHRDGLELRVLNPHLHGALPKALDLARPAEHRAARREEVSVRGVERGPGRRIASLKSRPEFLVPGLDSVSRSLHVEFLLVVSRVKLGSTVATAWVLGHPAHAHT